MSNDVVSLPNPTRLLINKNDKDEMINGRIDEAVILYPRLQEGEPAFGEEVPSIYSVQVAVTEETANGWASVFPKNTPKAVDNERFTQSFKIPPPFPNQPNQHILKLKTQMNYTRDNPERGIQAGMPVPYEDRRRPKVFEVTGPGQLRDVTMEKQVANGSVGKVGFNVVTNKFGTYPILSGVVVTQMIEAEKRNQMADMYGIEINEIITADPKVSIIPAEEDIPMPVQETTNTFDHDPIQQPVAAITQQPSPSQAYAQEQMDFANTRSQDASSYDFDF